MYFDKVNGNSENKVANPDRLLHNILKKCYAIIKIISY
jgi:hypothetical protein